MVVATAAAGGSGSERSRLLQRSRSVTSRRSVSPGSRSNRQTSTGDNDLGAPANRMPPPTTTSAHQPIACRHRPSSPTAAPACAVRQPRTSHRHRPIRTHPPGRAPAWTTNHRYPPPWRANQNSPTWPRTCLDNRSFLPTCLDRGQGYRRKYVHGVANPRIGDG